MLCSSARLLCSSADTLTGRCEPKNKNNFSI
jgi:hypothetical protein